MHTIMPGGHGRARSILVSRRRRQIKPPHTDVSIPTPVVLGPLLGLNALFPEAELAQHSLARPIRLLGVSSERSDLQVLPAPGNESCNGGSSDTLVVVVGMEVVPEAPLAGTLAWTSGVRFLLRTALAAFGLGDLLRLLNTTYPCSASIVDSGSVGGWAVLRNPEQVAVPNELVIESNDVERTVSRRDREGVLELSACADRGWDLV